MKAAMLFVVALLGGASIVDAATRSAASCSLADVAAQVNAANDGDTVVVPAGTCTWVGTLDISKSITLQGAGIDVTIIIDGNPGNASGKAKVLTWTTKTTGGSPAGFARLTGFTFHGGNAGGDDPFNDGHVTYWGNSANVRIDHNKFIPTRGVGMKIMGFIRGVMDHNVFQLDGGNWRQGLQIHHSSWGNVGGYGDNSWAQPNTFGTADFLFVEDNTFTNPNAYVFANDGWNGQRVVYRRNTFINSLWGNHGTETGGRPRSARAAEIYQNRFIGNVPSFVVPSVAGSRGGTHVVFDNTVTTTNGAYVTTLFDMQYYRQYDNTREFYVWGHCDGSNPWDGNSGPGGVGIGSQKGYRCVDQPGAGRGAYVSGDEPSAFSLNQALEPIYIWNNSKDGGLEAGIINENVTVVQLNREVYNQGPSFNGNSGVGRGPGSARPGTCTAGVGYWATDEGEWDQTNGGTPDGRLYKCVNTNTWSLFYTPFTYPHPLISGSGSGASSGGSSGGGSPPSSPTNLRIVSQ